VDSYRDLPRDRYRRDASFRKLVDIMVSMIIKSEFSPSEMREAAVLASTIYEERIIWRSRFIPVEDDRE
jgi:hypothetical protein